MKHLASISILLFIGLSIAANTQFEVAIIDSLIQKNYSETGSVLIEKLDTQSLNEVIDRSYQIDNANNVVQAQLLKGMYYRQQDQFLKSLFCLQTSLEKSRKDADGFLEEDILNGIGTTLIKLNRLEEAKQVLQSCIAISKSKGNDKTLYSGMGNLGNCYFAQGKEAEGLEIYLEIYEQREKIKSPHFLSEITNALGFAYLTLQTPEKALPFLEKSYKMAQEKENTKEIASTLGNLAYCYYLMKDFPKAYSFYKESLERSKNHPSITYVTYKDLSDTYLADNRPLEAIELLNKHYVLKDSVQGLKVQEQINAMQVQHQSALQQQEIKELNQDNKIKQQQLALAIGFVLVSLAIIGWLISDNSRRKQKEEVQQLKIENSKNELTLKSKELEFKKQDITNLALEINKKHEFNNQLLERLEHFKPNIQQVHQKDWHNLEIFVRENAQLNQEKRIFQDNIEQVNQAFFENLKTHHPKLTKGEKDLCAYLRLNLSNKEIAILRNTSMEAVKMGRYRLRKKLNLTPEEDIVELLQQF